MNHEEKMIVGLMSFSHALGHGFMLIFPAVLLLFQKEFSVDYLTLGVIANIMSFTYGLGALPGGIIYNRLGPRRIYLLCFLGSTITLVFIALTPNLLLLTIGLALLGIFGSLYHPMSNAIITGNIKEYGRALGIHGATGNIGLSVSPLAAGLIASYFGWRHAYLWFALPGMVITVWSLFINLTVKKDLKTDAPALKERTAGAKGYMVYFSFPLVLIYLINMLNSFAYNGSITFLPAYLANRASLGLFPLGSVAAGGILSSLVLFMGVFGQYYGGVWSQRKNPAKAVLMVSIAAFPFSLSIPFAKDLLLLVFAFIYFFVNFSLQPMNNALLARYTSAEMRGPGFGIYFFISFGLGSLASSFAGYIAHRFGLRWVYLGLSGSVLLMIFFALMLRRLERQTQSQTTTS